MTSSVSLSSASTAVTGLPAFKSRDTIIEYKLDLNDGGLSGTSLTVISRVDVEKRCF